MKIRLGLELGWLHNLGSAALMAIALVGCVPGYVKASDLEQRDQGPSACAKSCEDLKMRMVAMVLVGDTLPGCVCQVLEVQSPTPKPDAAPTPAPAVPGAVPPPASPPPAPASAPAAGSPGSDTANQGAAASVAGYVVVAAAAAAQEQQRQRNQQQMQQK